VQYFVDFLRDDEFDDDGVPVNEAPKIYEIGRSMQFLRARVESLIARFNEANPSKAMHLVLFDDAMKYLMRISRCLGMRKGCVLPLELVEVESRA